MRGSGAPRLALVDVLFPRAHLFCLLFSDALSTRGRLLFSPFGRWEAMSLLSDITLYWIQVQM
jgi:hypothetical protein